MFLQPPHDLTQVNPRPVHRTALIRRWCRGLELPEPDAAALYLGWSLLKWNLWRLAMAYGISRSTARRWRRRGETIVKTAIKDGIISRDNLRDLHALLQTRREEPPDSC